MKQLKEANIAIDLHSHTSTVGYMNKEGEFMGQQQVQTSAHHLINQVVAISAY